MINNPVKLFIGLILCVKQARVVMFRSLMRKAIVIDMCVTVQCSDKNAYFSIVAGPMSIFSLNSNVAGASTHA